MLIIELVIKLHCVSGKWQTINQEQDKFLSEEFGVFKSPPEELQGNRTHQHNPIGGRCLQVVPIWLHIPLLLIPTLSLLLYQLSALLC